jgi:hypothetical protein
VRPRRFFASAVATVVALTWPAGALAHVVRNPPVATNFEARVAAARIDRGAVQAKVVDGDRQLWLRVRAGVMVVIPGATGEPLLLFDRAGVFVNLRSLTAESDRIDSAHLRPVANPRARPLWRRVGAGHTYLWHEHRLHALEPLARGRSVAGVVGRWSVPLSINGRPEAFAGGLFFRPPGPLWPWLLLAGVLAGCVWLAITGSRTPANGFGLAAAFAVVAAVWVLRIGRELYGRPEVGTGGYVQVGLTSAFGAVLLCGLLNRNSDVRVVTALVAGLGALYQGLTMLAVLTHSMALTALPTVVAKTCVAASLGLGAGLLAIVLKRNAVARSDRAKAPRSPDSFVKEVAHD